MSTGILKRYTDVMSLLDILKHNRLSLLSPSRWFDQNDALGLKRYSEQRGDGAVYALCFAEGYEQAHHWQLFAGHSHGLCIQFDKSELVGHLDQYRYQNDILHGAMQYCNLKTIEAMSPIPTNTLPFLKRDTFKSESEYRIVAWEERWLAGDTFTIPIAPKMVRRVIFGPAMPDSLAQTLKEIVLGIEGCDEIDFAKSRLVNNARWEELIVRGTDSGMRQDD
jgi:hypothetical protein